MRRKPRETNRRGRTLVGCAGWSLPGAEQASFPEAGSHLERYSSRLTAVEINSSFHRSHRPATYIRWSSAVPKGFRFSVKMPKSVTHVLRLQGANEAAASFLTEASSLGTKLGCVLIQLPPSLEFEAKTARRFFGRLRALTALPLACEPRHASWFAACAEALLREFQIARVAADPPRVPAAAAPGGWRGLSYYRLHGSPKMYYSAYSAEFIAALATRLREDLAAIRSVWCIFDNTTLGAATGNALDLLRALESGQPQLS